MEPAESTPTAVVERFLERMRALDSEGAAALLAADVVYENKGLPTLRGRGAPVLTERTDVLEWGRMRVLFWVCGRFDVRDGEIVLWRDYFDYLAVFAATTRGLLGIFVPALRAKPPSGGRREAGVKG